MDQRTPMSERQQLALIKQLERAADDNSSSPCTPPRAPLQVVNGPRSGSSPSTPAAERLRKRMLRKNAKGETLLHRAAIKGNRRVAEDMLAIGIDPNETDNAGWTPLHEACNRGKLSVVRLLLKHGADINRFGGLGEQRETPLHDAVKSGHYEVVRYLVKKGADLSAKKDNGRTPLDEAKSLVEDLPQLQRIINFLSEWQGKDPQGLSDSDSDDDDCSEDESDLIRFLGLVPSPSIDQALQTLGLEGVKKQGNEPVSRKLVTKKRKHSNVAISARRKRLSKTRLGFGSDPCEVESTSSSTKPIKEGVTMSALPPLSPEWQNDGNAIETDFGNAVSAEERTLSSGKLTTIVSESYLKRVIAKTQDAVRLPADKTDSQSEPNKPVMKVMPFKIILPPPVSPDAVIEDLQPLPEAEFNLLSSEDHEPQVEEHDDDNGDPGMESVDMADIVSVEEPQAASVDDDAIPKAEGGHIDEVPDNKVIDTVESKVTEIEHQHYPEENIPPAAVGHDEGVDLAKQNSEEADAAAYIEYHVKKRKLRSSISQGVEDTVQQQRTLSSNPGSSGQPAPLSTKQQPLNDIQKYLNLRKQVELRRKNIFPVRPKPPQGYRDYLMNRKTYLLQGNASERLRSMAMIQPPPSLKGPLRELFVEQEKARHKLRKQHLVEKEKLVLTVEQEIIRVHGRAARALANQPLPYSVCTILRDEDIYTPISDPPAEEKSKDIRSRYNGRLFLSWLQDVDDKWEKIKEQMVLRHHNEAESLNAVQKMDWEWKQGELSGSDRCHQIDDLHIPMVHVSDDFDLSDSR